MLHLLPPPGRRLDILRALFGADAEEYATILHAFKYSPGWPNAQRAVEMQKYRTFHAAIRQSFAAYMRDKLLFPPSSSYTELGDYLNSARAKFLTSAGLEADTAPVNVATFFRTPSSGTLNATLAAPGGSQQEFVGSCATEAASLQSAPPDATAPTGGGGGAMECSFA